MIDATSKPGLWTWASFLGTTVVVLTIDMWLKYWAFATVAGVPVRPDPTFPGYGIPPHEPIVVIPHLLNLKLTLNTGAVFGLGQGGQPVFVVVSIVAAGLILWMFAQAPRRAWVLHLALALILAGAMGNLYDRLMFSAVRDLFWLLPTTGLWPWIFNLADAALMVGVGLALVSTWFYSERPKPPQASEKAPG
ncbi:signal peptidase II [Mucisphaera sp.]|uniref:signal peptidase II n=1 Tax=Mucisphaera sp. TaxID=2913024 RepID=UPI003D14D88D